MPDIDPHHPITVEPNPRRVTVVFNGYTIADTRQGPARCGKHRWRRCSTSRAMTCR